ncbi:MAG: cpaB [Moraxellaceae bacterium]|jgi:pilus assembly protein CpaB|nr:cpaB [Moraxellaceae bacterium]
MKNTRALALLALSILVGVLAVTMAVRLMNERSRVSTTDVVVAARDIALGSRIDSEMLKVVRWPAASQPTGVFHNESLLPGRVANTTFLAGEPILEAKLAAPGSKAGLSALIAPGTRAISVKVNEVVGVAGFALPGNYVDVLVHAEDERDRPFSRIVLERILVLAVAQQADRDETKPKIVNAVTLQVTPEEAEKLDLARGIGSLSLVLRNQVDTAPANTDGAQLADLAGNSAPAPAPVPVAAPAPVVAAAPAKAPVRQPVAKRPAVKKAPDAKSTPQEPKRPVYIDGVQVSE